jgi:hypothetical protein
MDRYTSSEEIGKWRETPPDFMAALEPNWSLMRPLLLTRADACQVPDMVAYSHEPGSVFRGMAQEVYDASVALDTDQRRMALYWDDNPNISVHRGHLNVMEHRISPPGHWLDIISQVTRRDGADLYTTTRCYTYAAIAMYDGLIACWREKFRTNVVRPITYIQEHIDPGWTALIQTPPFPEYPSGHSVVSAAAATVMDQVLGPDVPFTDSTEVLFGLGARRFASYQQAAWEVSMSRYYGGIHYLPSVNEGNRLGRTIAQEALARLAALEP